MGGVITRQQWKASPPKKVPTPLPWRQIEYLFIHYSSAEIDLHPDYYARVRGIQNFHQNTRRWNDIAYNRLFSRTGLVFEGRGLEIMSAATLNFNDRSQAFCFLGNDRDGRDDVTDEGRRALGEQIRNAIHEKKMAGGHGGVLKIKPHSFAVSTDCPGDELRAYIEMRGWEADEVKGYPKHFFKWAEWYLGEGKFKQYGPRKGPRPKFPRRPVALIYWVALRRFLKARKR